MKNPWMGAPRFCFLPVLKVHKIENFFGSDFEFDFDYAESSLA
jgi:hypothetical protein